jgi:signal transduction histidine kinase
MMSVRGYAELIAMSSVGDDDHRRWAGRIVEQVDRLEALHSRVDGALRESPELSQHSMAMIARAAIERSSHRMSGDAAAIGVRIRVTEDFVLDVDGEDLAEAIAVLIDNAREASAESGEGSDVELRLGAEGTDSWTLRVVDAGPGCTDRDRTRLGEPFFTRKAGHLGLGLFLSRSLLDRHGMQLDFEVASGGGTMATIRERRRTAGGTR